MDKIVAIISIKLNKSNNSSSNNSNSLRETSLRRRDKRVC